MHRSACLRWTPDQVHRFQAIQSQYVPTVASDSGSTDYQVTLRRPPSGERTLQGVTRERKDSGTTKERKEDLGVIQRPVPPPHLHFPTASTPGEVRIRGYCQPVDVSNIEAVKLGRYGEALQQSIQDDQPHRVGAADRPTGIGGRDPELGMFLDTKVPPPRPPPYLKYSETKGAKTVTFQGDVIKVLPASGSAPAIQNDVTQGS